MIAGNRQADVLQHFQFAATGQSRAETDVAQFANDFVRLAHHWLNEYFFSANRYNGNHTRRFIPTTTKTIAVTLAASNGKFPWSVQMLMAEPNPSVLTTWPRV